LVLVGRAADRQQPRRLARHGVIGFSVRARHAVIVARRSAFAHSITGLDIGISNLARPQVNV
jgi:hypothetical protein